MISRALGLFSYTFLRDSIFQQPLFFQLVIVTALMSVFTLVLLLFSAQVSRDMKNALIHLQDQHLRTIALFKRLEEHVDDIERDSVLDANDVSSFLQQLLSQGCLETQVGAPAVGCTGAGSYSPVGLMFMSAALCWGCIGIHR